MGCLLSNTTFWNRISGLCVAEVQLSFLQVIFSDLCIDTFVVVHCRSSMGPAYSLSRSLSVLNFHLFVRFYTSCIFFVSVHIHFLLVTRGCLEKPSSTLFMVWQENLSRLASSRLKPPITDHPWRKFKDALFSLAAKLRCLRLSLRPNFVFIPWENPIQSHGVYAQRTRGHLHCLCKSQNPQSTCKEPAYIVQ